MCVTPAYRRLSPVTIGQQATSSVWNPSEAAHVASASSSIPPRAAVIRPSFIERDPPGGSVAWSC
jgi:hypothetical protein